MAENEKNENAEDAKETQARKTFGMRISIDTQEKFKKILEKYKPEQAPKTKEQELALLRIIELADNESIRTTHPELAPTLTAIDQTISTLIQQLNGLVAAQDLQINTLSTRIEQATIEKNNAIAKAAKDIEAAQETERLANEHVQAAFESRDTAEQRAKESIETARREMIYKIEIATSERDRAIQERDDAKAIAEEKTVNNKHLLQQLEESKIWKEKYEKLSAEHKELMAEHSSLLSQNRENTIRQEYETEKAVMKKEQELRIEYEKKLTELQAEIAILKKAN